MSIKIEKYRKNDIIYLLLIIPYFVPGVISGHGAPDICVILDSIFNVFRLLTVPFILFHYSRKMICLKYNILLGLYGLTLVISTFINNGPILTSVIIFGTALSVCMLTCILIRKDKLYIVELYLKCIVVINFILMIIFPSGFYLSYRNECHFIGNKNEFAQFFIFTLTITYLNERKITRSFVFYTLISLISCFLGGSSTGIVIITIYTVLLILPFKSKLSALLNAKVANFVPIVLSFIITLFFTAITQIPEAAHFIQDVLGKELSFTGRTVFWVISYEVIRESPLWGAGWQGGFAYTRDGRMYAAHNGVLSVLTTRGYIGFALLIILMFACAFRGGKKKKSEYAYIINIGIFCVLLIGLMEAVFSAIYIYILLLMQYNSANIEGRDKDEIRLRKLAL